MKASVVSLPAYSAAVIIIIYDRTLMVTGAFLRCPGLVQPSSALLLSPRRIAPTCSGASPRCKSQASRSRRMKDTNIVSGRKFCAGRQKERNCFRVRLVILSWNFPLMGQPSAPRTKLPLPIFPPVFRRCQWISSQTILLIRFNIHLATLPVLQRHF